MSEIGFLSSLLVIALQGSSALKKSQILDNLVKNIATSSLNLEW